MREPTEMERRVAEAMFRAQSDRDGAHWRDDRPVPPEFIAVRLSQARALILSPERRKEISQKGVDARRERASLPKAICGDENRKLIFGNIEIQCYVLEDETRVLTMRSFQSGIGMSEGGGKGGARKIPALMARLAEKDIDIMDLAVRANSPIRFIMPSGAVADGYDARMLPDICAVLIEAQRRRILDRRYEHLAERAALALLKQKYG